MVSVISSLKNLASFQIAKFIWKSSFKPEGLHISEIQHDAERNWEIQLTIYRDETLRNVNTFVERNKLPFCFRNILSESIFILHEAYHQLILWKITYDPHNKIDVFEEGEFYAPKYFDASGKFNDILWIKLLMHNRNCPKNRRFSLALSYFLENECCTLCSELENFHEVFLENKVEFVIKEILWITSGILLKAASELKSILEPNEHGGMLEINYSPEFFYLVSLKGYEHAVYEMWRNMSESYKLDMIEDNRFFEIIAVGKDFPRCNVSYFLYSQLPKDKKQAFLRWSVQRENSEIWLTLLLTSRGGKAYLEILEFIYELPITMYSKLLQSLSHRLRQLKLPLDAELLQMLWNRVSYEGKTKILRNGTYIVENLVKAKSFSNVRCIIESLSFSVRFKFLVDEKYRLGTNVLDVLCKEGEFDLLQKYFSFFLVEKDDCITLPKFNPFFILNIFRVSSNFKTWFKNNLSEAERVEVNRRLRAVGASLNLFHEPCKKESNTTASSQFLSRISIFEKHFSIKETK